MKIKSIDKILLLCLLSMLIAGCSKPTYSVLIGNHTGQGIIFYDLPVATEKLWREKKMYPSIPGSNPGLSRFPYLVGDKFRLPDEVTIKWQLAKLTNCKREDSSRQIGGFSKEVPIEVNSEIYSWKMGCDWTPLEEKYFETTIDLRSFQKSDEFLELGKRHEGVQMSRNTAGIFFAFYGEEDIRIETYSGHTSTWQ